MDLRPATPADLPAIAARHAANWRRDDAGLMPNAALGPSLDVAMAGKLAPATLAALSVHVACEGGATLGFGAGRAQEGWLLDNLHVASAARGRRIGRALLLSVTSSAREAGAGPLWLAVLDGNDTARAVYRNRGAVAGRVSDDVIAGCTVPARSVAWDDPRGLTGSAG